MDEDDTTILKCDVELNVTAPSVAVADKWVADALRRAAAMIESGKLEDGFTDVLDGAGKKVGQVYVDYSGEVIR